MERNKGHRSAQRHGVFSEADLNFKLVTGCLAVTTVTGKTVGCELFNPILLCVTRRTQYMITVTFGLGNVNIQQEFRDS